jgi:hypothetical protein
MLIGCKDNSTEPEINNLIFGSSENPGEFGKSTSIVVYINPVVNNGTTPNIVMGTEREGIAVKTENGNVVYTDINGIAVLKSVPVKNDCPVYINDQIIYIDVLAEFDQYDVIVRYMDGSAQLVIAPIHYDYSENIKQPENFSLLNEQLRENNLIIVLDPDIIYEGNIEIRGNNIVILGQDPGSQIVGSVTVYGNNIRIIDIDIAGDLIVKGNNFEICYSEINNLTVEQQNVVILHNDIAEAVIINSEKVYLFNNK